MADKANFIMRVAADAPGVQAEYVDFERLIERVRAEIQAALDRWRAAEARRAA